MAQTTDMQQEWIKMFNELDENKDGELCKDEIKYLMRVCGANPTDEDVDEYIRDVDKNDDMKISCEEFCLFMEKQYAQGAPQDKLREAFDCFDKNKDNYIDREELKEILRKCNCVEDPDDEDVITKVIDYADLNGDGKIDFDEFVKQLQCVN
ncbi:troponin C, skeletal muscle-like [Mercenaria mercenaria]|uniref:troponin C, skeletal muscle-like n=1 Tax=Mercenaria mercenaria TaxID=6596 RepID=UPI00234F2D22|nr:troponin C, skeletal muscle-like [Mercenaria mercenaria]